MSKAKWLGRVSALTLALAIVVGGCDRSPEATRAVTGPVFSVQKAHGPKKVHEAHADLRTAGAAVKRIGSEGGVLELGGHRLTVPAGAVPGPTLFKATLDRSGFIEISLQAVRSRADGSEADVGAAGFARPLVLELSYRSAAGVTDPSKLGIAWVLDDGTLVPLPSVVDTATQTVRAELQHFSRYAMTSN